MDQHLRERPTLLRYTYIARHGLSCYQKHGLLLLGLNGYIFLRCYLTYNFLFDLV
jgi:hypothetical protein